MSVGLVWKFYVLILQTQMGVNAGKIKYLGEGQEGILEEGPAHESRVSEGLTVSARETDLGQNKQTNADMTK